MLCNTRGSIPSPPSVTTLKAATRRPVRSHTRRRALKWLHHLRLERRAHVCRPPPEPPPCRSDSDVMTGTTYPDSSDTDSLLNPSPMLGGSISTTSSVPSLWTSCSSDVSDDKSNLSSDYDPLDDDFETPPPPAGSLMSFWDRLFDPTSFGDFPELVVDRVPSDWTQYAPTVPDDQSVSSTDSSTQWNPYLRPPVMSVAVVKAAPRLVDLDGATVMSKPGQLIDSGGNFNMCHDLSLLVNARPIEPFTINMAAKEGASTSRCTHRGDFSIPMSDGSVFYTTMFFNPSASDTILSPEYICLNSRGYLVRWVQEGGPHLPDGAVSFYDTYGKVVIRLKLTRRHGLYYTTTSAIAVDDAYIPASREGNTFACYHTELDDDDASWDMPSLASGDSSVASDNSDDIPLAPSVVFRDMHKPPHARASPQPPPATAKSTPPLHTHIDADLWQARLGHCSEWQLRVLPHAVTGTP